MKDLNKIDNWDGLLALVTKGLTEGSHLDFKRDAYWDQRKPPDKRDRDKEELRRDAKFLQITAEAFSLSASMRTHSRAERLAF
ncbi:hypothetical protein F0U62_35770 [Cystobacter fuscus]|uniref:hypothetical protein n=1 Tax=Cystobacter fuscus TaxID=43 RepID=UPI002B32350E|nr:hypothetical protein F0U62_35770 [Cystobacter fuscus]